MPQATVALVASLAAVIFSLAAVGVSIGVAVSNANSPPTPTPAPMPTTPSTTPSTTMTMVPATPAPAPVVLVDSDYEFDSFTTLTESFCYVVHGDPQETDKICDIHVVPEQLDAPIGLWTLQGSIQITCTYTVTVDVSVWRRGGVVAATKMFEYPLRFIKPAPLTEPDPSIAPVSVVMPLRRTPVFGEPWGIIARFSANPPPADSSQRCFARYSLSAQVLTLETTTVV